MKKALVVCGIGLVALAGCGDDEERAAPASGGERAAKAERAPKEAPRTKTAARETPKPKGTTITLGESDFGSMLFDSRKQAIYIFERDRKDETVCYGECAEAWPPVYTKGEPVAGRGVKQSLLGTIERRDGRQQVTYAGQPLYFYVNEGPGEVRCHSVNLNGGLWWVVGPDGKRRP